MYRVMIIPDQQLFDTNGSFDFRIEAFDAYDNAIANIEISWSSQDGQITRTGTSQPEPNPQNTKSLPM